MTEGHKQRKYMTTFDLVDPYDKWGQDPIRPMGDEPAATAWELLSTSALRWPDSEDRKEPPELMLVWTWGSL